MTLRAIYEFIVNRGLAKDPRTKRELDEEYARVRAEYAKLGKEDKRYFDKDRFKHPYTDTRILYGPAGKDIQTMMVGVDIGGEELLTAYLLNEKGAGIDLAMSHHPAGRALSGLYNVMHVHTDVLKHLGVKKDVAKALVKERLEEVYRRFSSVNHQRSVDIARLLNIPFMCVHTAADNHVAAFLKNLFEKRKPRKVRDVLRILKGIPEYRDAMAKGAGPHVLTGKEGNPAGKVFVDMTGGTEGSKRVFARLSQAGVNTIVGMHLSEEHFKAAKAEFLNVVIAGHIASDNLGLNLLMDALVKKHPVNIIPCSGFVRIKR
jgi:hypothetical protein